MLPSTIAPVTANSRSREILREGQLGSRPNYFRSRRDRKPRSVLGYRGQASGADVRGRRRDRRARHAARLLSWRRRMRRLALAERRSSAHLDHVRDHVSVRTYADCRVLAHTAREHKQLTVNAVILVGDACEEPARSCASRLATRASRPSFQEGDDPDVTRVYSELASLTGGAVASFDVSAAQRLADLLKAVAAFATGGVMALAAQETDAAMLLLGQIKRGGKT